MKIVSWDCRIEWRIDIGKARGGQSPMAEWAAVSHAEFLQENLIMFYA